MGPYGKLVVLLAITGLTAALALVLDLIIAGWLWLNEIRAR